MIAKISIILLLFLSCTVSPRYGVQSSDSTKKTKKNIKYSKKNKNSSELKVVSSWYGRNFHGKLTANGEVYDLFGVTAAHKTLTLGTVVRVTNLDNGKSLILRINDRGPYVAGRILDCSFGAAKKLGFHEQGTANVEIKIIEEGDGVYMHHN